MTEIKLDSKNDMNTLHTHEESNLLITHIITAILFILLLLCVSLYTPAQMSPKSEAEQNPTACPNTPQKATLNPFPVSNGDKPCTDLPALFIEDEKPLDRNTNARIGDQIVLVISIYNGANIDGFPAETVARNIRLMTFVDTRIGSKHQVAVSFRGDNTNTVESKVIINTPPGSVLRVVPKSGEQLDSKWLVVRQGFNVGNNTISFGHLPPGYDESFYIRFSVEIIDGRTIGDSRSAQSQPAARARDEELLIASKARRYGIFWQAWSIVNDFYYDPSFGGVDWKKTRDEYEPHVIGAATDIEAYMLIQEMFNKLRRSHLTISLPSQNDDEDASSDEASNPSNKIDAENKAKNGIRIDLRLIEEMLIVTRVDSESSAEKAGLRLGFVIEAIDGDSVDKTIKKITEMKGYGSGMPRTLIPTVISKIYFNGFLGTSVTLSYRDDRDVLHTAKIPFEKLQGSMTQPFGADTSEYLEFESKMLKEGVGYIRFNAFAVPVMEKLCAALHTMKDAPGIIIDLRGNGGGLNNVMTGIAALLEPSRTVYGKEERRQGTNKITRELKVIPSKFRYSGRVVVLIDDMSMSASELLAFSLHHSGRAVVVGDPSVGYLLGAENKKLWNGASVQVPVINFVAPNGDSLEGRGVVPDIKVRLTRTSLLSGVDDQLRVAIEQAQKPLPRAKEVTETRTLQPTTDTAQSTPTPSDILTPAQSSTAPTSAGAVDHQSQTLPKPSEIIENYIRAIGGREALAKITSRVAKGKITSSEGINVDVEIYQKKPNKSVVIRNNGQGVSQEGLDGSRAWSLTPFWFTEMRDKDVSPIMHVFDLNGIDRLIELFPKMTTLSSVPVQVNKERRMTYLVKAEAADGSSVYLYFGIQTKLLLVMNNIYFDDYRKVDGVMLPFSITDLSGGNSETIRLEKIEHNVPINSQKLAQLPSCFAQ